MALANSNYNQISRGLSALQRADSVYRSIPAGTGQSIINYGSNMGKRMLRWSRKTQNKRSFKRARTSGRRSTSGNGGGVTTQHDTTNVYRKSRMPRRKKRNWVKFSKKVHAVAEKELGSRTVVFSSQPTFYNSDPVRHGLAHVAIYGAKSTSLYLNDLSGIVGLENAASPTQQLGETVDKTTKFIFQSAVMDLTMRNTSGGYQDAAELLDSNMSLEVDVYDISSPIVWDNGTSGGLPDLKSLFDLGQITNTKEIGGTGTGIEISNRGVTPFECCQSLSRYRLRINSKKKYFIPAGATATYQIRDPKRHTTSYAHMEKLMGCNKPGWTRNIFIVFKSVPGTVLSAIAPVKEERLKIGITRKYMYKIEGMNDTRDRYIIN